MLLLRWRHCSGTHTINVMVRQRQHGHSCLKDDGSTRLPECILPCVSVADEDGISAVTTWIVGDFEKESGRKLLLNALSHLVSFLLPVSAGTHWKSRLYIYQLSILPVMQPFNMKCLRSEGQMHFADLRYKFSGIICDLRATFARVCMFVCVHAESQPWSARGGD